MSNPFASPTTENAEQSTKWRFGLVFLFMFLIMFGGCVLVSILYWNVSTPRPVPPSPAPAAQPSASETPTEAPAE